MDINTNLIGGKMKKYLSKIKNYILTNLSLLSHVLNGLTGGCRFYTFSARTHYCAQVLQLKGWKYIEKAIDMLFFWETDHCKTEYAVEKHNRWAPF